MNNKSNLFYGEQHAHLSCKSVAPAHETMVMHFVSNVFVQDDVRGIAIPICDCKCVKVIFGVPRSFKYQWRSVGG